jgi:putative serine protease PepD
MTDPLLWLHGDPTEGRRARVPEPGADPATPPAAGTAPPPAPTPPPRSARPFRAALAGGLVSATLVGAGALGLGLIDTGGPAATAAPPAAAAPASSAAGATKEGDVAAIYRAASPSVVSVRTGSGSGTGFVVDADGTLVTNAHVVGDASSVQVHFSDERTATATVSGVDTSSDLAVLRVDTADTGPLRALELADSSTVRTGQLAVAIGSPFGLSQTTTAGIVSGTGRHIQAPDGFQIDSVIQTDAPINPGNSGGPLLDANGRVIGVNSQIATGGNGNGNVGIGFAVPSNTVRDVIPRLERGETIRRAYLGVSTSAGTGGPVVAATTPGGPAATAGLRAGDVITAVDGKRVRTPDDVAAAVQDRRPGDSVAVEVRRGGGTRTLDVELAARPEQAP